MKTKEELIAWLRDAHAMEKAMELALRKIIDNQSAPMMLREKAGDHLVETENHAIAVESCLKALGADTSAGKAALAQMFEVIKGSAAAFADDEPIKDMLAAYAAEHFEIACYTALREAAMRLGLEDIIELCDAIIADEAGMAIWLREHLPELTSEWLSSDGA